MANVLLLRLPHRLVTITLPKMLRAFFKYDRKLFSEVSRLIFGMVQDYPKIPPYYNYSRIGRVILKL